MQNNRDRLIELLKETEEHPEKTCPHYLEADCFDCPYDRGEDCDREARKADYLLANGVIVPKFNVGDTVWYMTGIHRTLVKSAIVEEIIINCNGVSDLFVTSDTGSFENSVDIFYHTKEEAEEKLKECEG